MVLGFHCIESLDYLPVFVGGVHNEISVVLGAWPDRMCKDQESIRLCCSVAEAGTVPGLAPRYVLYMHFQRHAYIHACISVFQPDMFSAGWSCSDTSGMYCSNVLHNSRLDTVPYSA